MKRLLAIALTVICTLSAGSAFAADPSPRCAPIRVSASDLISKAYGMVDPTLPLEQFKEAVKRDIHLTPTTDEYGMWLETADGFSLIYGGQAPEVVAKAAFKGSDLSDFAYFFIFPYASAKRESADVAQSEFSTRLLNDLHTLGLPMVGSSTMVADAIFIAGAESDEGSLAVRLDEEKSTDGSGRFVLMVSIEPAVFTAFRSK